MDEGIIPGMSHVAFKCADMDSVVHSLPLTKNP